MDEIIKTWKKLSMIRASTNEEKELALSAQYEFIGALRDCFLICLDDDRDGLFLFQNPKVYDKFSYIDYKDDDLITIHADNKSIFSFKTTICFNYTKMLNLVNDDDFGDEFECFLLEWTDYGNFENFINEQGVEDVCSRYELKFLGFTRVFSKLDDEFIRRIVVDILDYYFMSISLDHPGGYVRNVRAREKF